LVSSIATVRERNNNSLSGIKLPKIIDMVDKVLKEKTSKKQGNYIVIYCVHEIDLLGFVILG
jgi:hypothetical protein